MSTSRPGVLAVIFLFFVKRSGNDSPSEFWSLSLVHSPFSSEDDTRSNGCCRDDFGAVDAGCPSNCSTFTRSCFTVCRMAICCCRLATVVVNV